MSHLNLNLCNPLIYYQPLNEVGRGYTNGFRASVRECLCRIRSINRKPFKISQLNLVHIISKKP